MYLYIIYVNITYVICLYYIILWMLINKQIYIYIYIYIYSRIYICSHENNKIWALSVSWITYDHLSHTDSSFCKTLKVSSCCIKEKMILRFMRLCFVPLMSSIPWSPTAYIFCSHVYAYLPSAPQVLIYSLNFENDVSDFIFDGRLC